MVTQALLPSLTRSRGRIVNVVSIGAFAAVPVLPAYSASKAAAFSVTQSLRALLAGRGVKVHAVLPGPIDTDMVRDLPHPEDPSRVGRPRHLRRHRKRGGRDLPRPAGGDVCRELAHRSGQGVRTPERDARPGRAPRGMSDRGEGGRARSAHLMPADRTTATRSTSLESESNRARCHGFRYPTHERREPSPY